MIAVRGDVVRRLDDSDLWIYSHYDASLRRVADQSIQAVGSRDFTELFDVDTLLRRHVSTRRSNEALPPPTQLVEPLYLGIGAPTGIGDWDEKHLGPRPGSTRERMGAWYATGGSLSPRIVWDDANALGELKALLLYADRVAVVHPFEDIVDDHVIGELGGRESVVSWRGPPGSLLEAAVEARYGQRRSMDKFVDYVASSFVSRSLLFLAVIEPFLREGWIRLLTRPREASLGLVEQGLRSSYGDRPLEAMPRAEVRAQVMVAVARQHSDVALYSPSKKELGRATEILGLRQSDEDVLSNLGRLALPSPHSLPMRDLAAIRMGDSLARCRVLIREVLQASLIDEELDSSWLREEAEARSHEVRTEFRALTVPTAVSVALGSAGGYALDGAVGAIAGGVTGLLPGAVEGAISVRANRSRRRVLMALEGLARQRLSWKEDGYEGA